MASINYYNYLSFLLKLILLAYYPNMRLVKRLIPVRDCWNIVAVNYAIAKVKLWPNTCLFAAY